MIVGQLPDRQPPMKGRTPGPGADYLAPRFSREKKINRCAFGWRHAAVDIFAPRYTATPVYSPEAGTVAAFTTDAKSGSHFGSYGPGVVVVRGKASGLYHWLAHLIDINVGKDEDVLKGQVVGATARAWKNPHVHWEVRTKLWCPYKGDELYPWMITVDPWRWLQGTVAPAQLFVKGLENCQSVPRAILRPQVVYPIRWDPAAPMAQLPTVDPVAEAIEKLEEKEALPTWVKVALGAGAAIGTVALIRHYQERRYGR